MNDTSAHSDPADPKPPSLPEEQRFPEGRERLFALSESPCYPEVQKSVASNTNFNRLRKSLRVPKMGLRDVRTRNGNSIPPSHQLKHINGAQMCTSEQSLPDRLTQALRGLSVGLRLSTNNDHNGGMIAADDVLYFSSNKSGEGSCGGGKPTEPSYSNVNDYRSSENLNGTPPRSGRLPSINSPPKYVQTPGRPFGVGKETTSNQNQPGTSLAQLRQMYKSMPDCSTLGRSYVDDYCNEPAYCRITALPIANNDEYTDGGTVFSDMSSGSSNGYPLHPPPVVPSHPRSLAANSGAFVLGLVSCGETSTDESGLSSDRRNPHPPPVVAPRMGYRTPPNNSRLESQKNYANVDNLKPGNPQSMANTNSSLFNSFDSHGLESSCESVPGSVSCPTGRPQSSDTGGSSPTDSGYRSVSRHLLELEQHAASRKEQPNPETQPNGSCRVFVNGNTPPLEDRLRPSVAPKPTPPSRSNTKYRANGENTNINAPTPSNYPKSSTHTATSHSRMAERRMNVVDSPISVDVTKPSKTPDVSPKTNEKSSTKSDKTSPGILGSRANGSFDTINTNVSLPEEFSLEMCPKLVEIDRPPWDERAVVTVLQRGRTKDLVHRIAIDAVPRLTYLLQRPLVRLTRELFRLSQRLGKSTPKDVQSAVKVILPSNLADSCIKAGIQATSLYCMGIIGDSIRQSKSRRAALRLSVGRFHRWLCDAQPSVSIHEQSSVFMTAVCECLLEELVLQCIPSLNDDVMLTCETLALALASNSDLWGLLQPYEHLISSRTANGVLSLPSFFSNPLPNHDLSRTDIAGFNGSPKPGALKFSELEQSLLATCVGTVQELAELIYKLNEEIQERLALTGAFRGSQACLNGGMKSSSNQKIPGFVWSHDALEVLFHFMRCSQLEHSDDPNHFKPVRLAHERPYLVLPPLCDWMRVSQAYCDHRGSTSVDGDDVRQGARVLLPSLDCPPRSSGSENIASSTWRLNTKACTNRFRQHLAFQILETGRIELYQQALQLLGPQKFNSFNNQGLTALMLACLRGDEMTAAALLESGADPNISVPATSDQELYPQLLSEFAGWTPLTFAVAKRHLSLVRLLLDKYAEVEFDFMVTDTPLQMAAMSGVPEIVSLLLTFSADPFKSTMDLGDGSSFSASYKQKGAPCPLALAAAHGHRNIVHSMLQQGRGRCAEEPLTLEDFLKEGQGSKIATPVRNLQHNRTFNASTSSVHSNSQWSKKETKALQEAMYCAAECRHLEITMDIRNLGITWNAHVWAQTLAASQEVGDKALIQQLLEDFNSKQNKFMDEITSDFIDDALPLLFDVFRHTKNGAITSLLAQILSNLYGEQDPDLPSEDQILTNGGTRVAGIDPSFVNNPELSDVTFLIDGRILYAHKIVLVNASSRFKKLVGISGAEKQITIEDITYDVFELMMEYLYRGSITAAQQVGLNDWMQLLAAGSDFGVVGLVKLCQFKLCKLVQFGNCLEIYKFAMNQKASVLASYCEGFFLLNLRRLMSEKHETSDEFRKTVHASRRHASRSVDLCSGMITVLSNRIEHKLSTAKRN